MTMAMENKHNLLSDSLCAGEVHPISAIVCLFGFFLHIILSDPLLNILGFHYSGSDGAFYEKIHPGTVFIFVSFGILLCDRGRPIQALLEMLKKYPAYLLLLILYFFYFLYLMLRSGPEGTAFIIDTHMTVPICALVLSYAPAAYCRKAVMLFLAVAAANSAIGLAEAYGKFRIFNFGYDWSVLHEQYFRASALRGHPLVNALLSSIAVFTACAIRLPAFVKAMLIILFIVSLFAFGSRSALLFTLTGVTILGVCKFAATLLSKQYSLLQVIKLTSVVLIVPTIAVGLIVLLSQSAISERLMAAAHWDDSANSRVMAAQVFDHMSEEDILFGISGKRIMEITDNLNNSIALGGVENPWLLMLMFFGAILFPFWLLATGAFLYRLLYGKPLALQFAVVSYIVIASTFNSFGTKDSTYLIMTTVVVCAAALPDIKRQDS